MFDSINIEQEADIAKIQEQDSTRHDQELPMDDKVSI